jgi:glycosyltransferase involved in cell wall biosynthesis
MKITIVTVSYNQANYLEKAICSVIEQGYSDLEYIVVDPGSSDGSREIIERYRSRISRIIFESDNGPADGLNKGFKAATGEIYGFLNSDDVLELGALDDVANFFECNPGVDVVSGVSWIIDPKGLRLRKFFSDRYCLWMAARGASILSQSSTFFRASAFKNVAGFNVQNSIAWDGELYADMALNGAQFHYVNRIWSEFRIHDQGITGSGSFHKENNQYARYLFKKITGRNMNSIDLLGVLIAKNIRKVFNFRDTYNRILYGPIYQRKL